MRLFYLTSEHWAKVILKERRLKISRVEELNDPFELLGASVGSKRARKIVKYVHGRLSETFGLVCMSTTWQSPVMWAHYGDKHRGVCLGFEVPEESAKQVDYTPRRLEKLLGDTPKLSNVNNDVITALLTTKSSEWLYEQERRLVVRFSNAERGDSGLHFIPFGQNQLSLREVILGHRCEWELAHAARAVGKVSAPVSLKRVRPSFQEFSMVRQNREETIRILPKA